MLFMLNKKNVQSLSSIYTIGGEYALKQYLLTLIFLTLSCLFLLNFSVAYGQVRTNDGIFNSYTGNSFKIQVGGTTQASITSTGLFDISGTLIVSDSGETCNATTEGAIRYNSTGAAHDYCNGTIWSPIASRIDSVVGAPAPVLPLTYANIEVVTGATTPNFVLYALDDISNVNAAAPTGGECLVFDGTNWANSTSCGTGITSVVGAAAPVLPLTYANIEVVAGATAPIFDKSLGGLSDVSNTAPADGEVLTWVNATSSWAPAAITSSGLWTDETTQISRTGVVLIDGSLGLGGITSPNAALDISGSIEYTGTILDKSDRRLKDKIKPLPAGQLSKIIQIKPVSFVMKNNPSVEEYGVIAQELEPIYPTLVHTATDKMGTKSVNYIGLITPLIQAVQEINENNKKLENENKQLRARLNALEAK